MISIISEFLNLIQYNNYQMINEDSMLFPKQIKIDDYEPPSENNLIRIMETSNLLLGNGGKSSVAVMYV